MSYYGMIAGKYDGTRFAPAKGRFRDRMERRIITGLLRDVRGKALDVGCGTGRMTWMLHGMGLDVVGMDASPEMLRVARKKHPGICFVLGDIEKGVPPGKYDAVLMSRVFFHLKDPEKALKNVARCLKPGGFVVFDFHNLASLKPLLLMHPRFMKGGRQKAYSLAQMRRLIRPLGIVDYRGLVFSPFSHADAAMPFVNEGLECWLSSSPLRGFGERIFVKAQKPS